MTTLKDKLRSYGKTAALVAVLAAAGFGLVKGCLSYYGNERTITTINGTEAKRYDDKDKYLIYTDAGTFEDTDCWFKWKWNSSDVYGEAKKFTGKKAEITHYGWRWTFKSWYPNVVEINEVKD